MGIIYVFFFFLVYFFFPSLAVRSEVKFILNLAWASLVDLGRKFNFIEY